MWGYPCIKTHRSENQASHEPREGARSSCSRQRTAMKEAEPTGKQIKTKTLRKRKERSETQIGNPLSRKPKQPIRTERDSVSLKLEESHNKWALKQHVTRIEFHRYLQTSTGMWASRNSDTKLVRTRLRNCFWRASGRHLIIKETHTFQKEEVGDTSPAASQQGNELMECYTPVKVKESVLLYWHG